MRIGVPREIKSRNFASASFPRRPRNTFSTDKFVEKGARVGAGLYDYERAGATIAASAEAIFARRARPSSRVNRLRW
jgi:alanine dehydrogenase